MDSLFVFLAVFSFLTVCTILFFIQRPKLKRFEEIAGKVQDGDKYLAEKQAQADAIKADLSAVEKEKSALEKEKLDFSDKQVALETLRLDIQKKYNDNMEHRRKLQEYRAKLQRREQEIQENEQAFRKIEHNALVAINRWERKEWEYLQELQDSADKLSMYSSIVRRRNGFLFESYVADMLKENGFTDVEVTKASGDYGGDVFAVKNGLNYIFQCKYYSQPVGIHAVQEAASARTPYNADRAIVVTNNVFTTAAQQLAKSNGVELWDCSDLARMNTKGEFY